MSKQHLNKVANPSDAGLENLSPEADAYLAGALEDFNARQRAMKQEWHFDTYERWGFEQLTGNFRLEFADGRQLLAEGQILGSYSFSTSGNLFFIGISCMPPSAPIIESKCGRQKTSRTHMR